MPNNPIYLIHDFETYSECDLKAAGAYEYAAHPSTEIICVGYVAGTLEELRDTEARLLVPPTGGAARDTEYMRLLTDPDVKIVAHNLFFERCITELVLPRYRHLLRSDECRGIPISRMICTAALARAVSLPGKLDEVTRALAMLHQKDMAGHRLMLKHSKPRKPTKHDPSTRHTDVEERTKIHAYCLADVEAERELFLRLPPLHPFERRIWELNQEMNWRGFAVDRKLVAGALHCIARETTRLDRQFQELTGLDSARQRDATLSWLRENGCFLENLRADTVDAVLPSAESPAKEVLEIRQSISKSSTAKYEKFDVRSVSDGRARDNTQYHGAHTGRDAGTGLQPHNLYKSTLAKEDLPVGIDLMHAKDAHMIEALFPSPMELYSSALRGCIVAPKGKVLDVGDFATIEVRVLFWLAGHRDGLEALRGGRDLYVEMATDIFEDRELGLANRQLGKVTVLGAGFGMGLKGDKFQQAAKGYGLDISLALASKSIRSYRERHAPVVKFWDVIEAAATRALQNPGKAYRHGHLIWKKDGDWLTCRLPSGRRLHYFSPALQRVNTIYGERVTLTYKGVEPVSRKFLRLSTWGGKLTENVVQAVARDVLYSAMLRLERNGYNPVLAVHDEIICERDENFSSTKAFENLMARVPRWAEGLPIKVEAWCDRRYRK